MDNIEFNRDRIKHMIDRYYQITYDLLLHNKNKENVPIESNIINDMCHVFDEQLTLLETKLMEEIRNAKKNQ